MEKFWGSLSSYFFAIVILALGIGGMVYFYLPNNEPEPELIDISADTGYDWKSLNDGMYVQLNANNACGFRSFETDENGKDISRLYFVYNYSQKTNKYDYFISVYVKSSDFEKWDSLESEVFAKGKYMKTLTVANYVHKMDRVLVTDIRNSMLIDGIDDMDELEKLIVPYYIGPKTIVEKPKYIRNISLIVAGFGLILLIGSIIGSIVKRY